MSTRSGVTVGLCEFVGAGDVESDVRRSGTLVWLASTVGEAELRRQAERVCREHGGELVGLYEVARVQPGDASHAMNALLQLAHDFPGECVMGQMFVYDPGERELLLATAISSLRQ